MNVLVTGGAGFIGSHIVDAYLAKGHKVVVIDNLETGNRGNIAASARFYEMDINQAPLEKIFNDEKIEIVNHHAAQASLPTSLEDPVFDARVNILATIELLKACVNSGIKRFILASTAGAILGKQDVYPADENHPIHPLSPYGISKLCSEYYVNYYGEYFGLKPIVLRYSNVFGARQNHLGEAGVVASFCHRLANNQPLIINGDGDQTRDFISVWDVVEANVLALDSHVTGTFNIGTGKETSINELAETLIKISRQQVELENRPARDSETRRSSVDGSKFEKSFGWNPGYSFSEGLEKTLNYFKAI